MVLNGMAGLAHIVQQAGQVPEVFQPDAAAEVGAVLSNSTTMRFQRLHGKDFVIVSAQNVSGQNAI